VDFAYAVHTSVGHRCRFAKVNGRLVPLNYTLQSGDRVEIITGSEEKPSRDWLAFVKTSKARNAIRHFLRKVENERARKLGETLLDRAVRKLSDKSLGTLSGESVEEALRSLGYSTLDSALVEVGYYRLDPEKLARRLLGIAEPEQDRKKKTRKERDKAGVTVDGIDNVMVSLASCCHPLPGDRVVGVVNSGKGIVIHTANCTVARQVAESSPGRIVRVDFLPSDRLYNAKVRVSVEDKPGMLASVSSAIAKFKINIASVGTRKSHSGWTVMDFVLQVKSRDELTKVIQAIKGVKGVIAVKRTHSERARSGKKH
jgi:GTP pyrophosphokinase